MKTSLLMTKLRMTESRGHSLSLRKKVFFILSNLTKHFKFLAERIGGQANMDMTSAGDKKRRVIKNPQPKLNPDRLMGPRGIQTIEDLFENWESKGKGREFDDLDVIMTKLEHWAHRLYPKLPFDNVVDVVANRLGKKKAVQTHIKKIRLNMVTAPVHVGGDAGDSEEEREVARYGEGDQEQPDVFQELLRRAGGGDEELPPVRTQPPAATNSGLTEDQRERMRRMKEAAAEKKREKAEREQREAEEAQRRAEVEKQFDEEEEMERELMADTPAMTSTKNMIEDGNTAEDSTKTNEEEQLDLDAMMDQMDED